MEEAREGAPRYIFEPEPDSSPYTNGSSASMVENLLQLPLHLLPLHSTSASRGHRKAALPPAGPKFVAQQPARRSRGAMGKYMLKSKASGKVAVMLARSIS